MLENLSVLRKEKDAEIEDKDVRLQRMKKQMAETLKGNSWYASEIKYFTSLEI